MTKLENSNEKTNKTMKPKLIIYLSLILFVSILLILILYLANFGSWNLSESFSDWLAFSSYFYNFLILILTLINIIVISFIAKIAQSFDTTKHLQNIEKQEEYEKIRRFHEFKMKLIEIFDKITENIVINPNFKSLAVSQSTLDNFIKLFSKEIFYDKNKYEELISIINNIGENINNISNELIEKYIIHKDEFINNLIESNNVNK